MLALRLRFPLGLLAFLLGLGLGLRLRLLLLLLLLFLLRALRLRLLLFSFRLRLLAAAVAAAAAAAAAAAVANVSALPRVGDDNVNVSSALGKFEVPVGLSIETEFSIFHLNVQGLLRNLAEFDALLERAGRPAFVAVTETWLDRTTESVSLSGYHMVSRLDRRKGIRFDRGGIAVFARSGFEMSIVHVEDSKHDERSWHIIHADCGPILLGVWYRRPCQREIASIRHFDEEFQVHSQDSIASIVVGDMNVHNREWLRWSNGTTLEGLELEAVCCIHGLRQHVQSPTRGDYLLDLVLSSFESGLTCKVLPGVNDKDHEAVLATVKLHVPATEPVRRKVFDFKKLIGRESKERWRTQTGTPFSKT